MRWIPIALVCLSACARTPSQATDGVGDESQGRSACERGCNLDGDVFVHKRLVARTYNVVSVVYTYGLSVDEGNTDWWAIMLSETVVKRANGE